MPSEIANKIVDHIFGDEKAKAIDATNDALSAASYDAIQAKKIDFAKQWGFNPDETGQAVADELADKATDGTEVEPETVEVTDRKPEDPPEDVMADEVPDPLPPNTAVVDSIEPIEEPKDETDS
tara:strand:+ start:541 stop:912 length:372 start_codon:yes stop_codon:yes gene_type:complete